MPTDSFPTWRSVWDMATGKETSKLEGHNDTVSSVAISLDGKTIVSGSWDITIR
jgi:WD40 repeat protein